MTAEIDSKPVIPGMVDRPPVSAPPEATSAQRRLLTCLSMDIDHNQAFPGDLTEEDWRQIVNLAEEDGLAPLLFYSITRPASSFDVPPPIYYALRQFFRQSLLENMGLLNRVSQLLRSLAQAGIPVILLKGIYLLEHIYPSPACRRMGDIDLLVPRDKLAAASSLLLSQGYLANYSFIPELECQSSHHLPGLGHPNGLVVELHWTLVPPGAPFKIPIDEIWERSLSIDLIGVPCRTLSIEDLLLHLSLHTAYLEHFNAGLRPLCDIAWAIHIYHDQINWNMLALYADQWGARRCLWLALQLAKDFLNMPMTVDELDKFLPEDSDPHVVDWAAAQVFHPADLGGKLAAVWAPNPWNKRAALFVKQLFPPAHEMRPAYPWLAHGMFWPLAYSWHLLIVLRRNWKMAWRLLRHDPAAGREAQQRERINYLVAWLGTNFGKGT